MWPLDLSIHIKTTFVQKPPSDEASAISEFVADMAVDKESKTPNAAAAQGKFGMTAPEACEQ